MQARKRRRADIEVFANETARPGGARRSGDRAKAPDQLRCGGVVVPLPRTSPGGELLSAVPLPDELPDWPLREPLEEPLPIEPRLDEPAPIEESLPRGVLPLRAP